MSHSFIQNLLDNSSKKVERLVSKRKVKLSVRCTWNSLMAWPDWPDPPIPLFFATDLGYTPLLIATYRNVYTSASSAVADKISSRSPAAAASPVATCCAPDVPTRSSSARCCSPARVHGPSARLASSSIRWTLTAKTRLYRAKKKNKRRRRRRGGRGRWKRRNKKNFIYHNWSDKL